MSSYLFIQSRDPITDRTVELNLNLMCDLLNDSKEVTLFLVQEAVMLAKKGILTNHLENFLKKGGKVFADEFSLKIREVDNLKEDVKIAAVSVITDALLDQHKVVWN